MFSTYPLAATADNWISNTLLEILRIALEALQAGVEPSHFHDLVPAQYQVEFARGRKFSGLYVSFVDQCRPLDAPQRDLIIGALANQNHFPGLFAVGTQSPGIAEALPAVHQAARNLFEYAFEKLSALRTPGTADTVRDNYHQLVHAHLDRGCCPFCGLELIDAPDPDLVRPDLDHYLAVSKYPFAGANLRNLTAMGTNCNRSYKGAADILLDELNQRADCMDPYGNEHVTLSLAGTVLLPGSGQGPAWVLSFNPDMKSRNWRRVFNVETRLRANVLARYQTWLGELNSYAQKRDFDLRTMNGALKAIRGFRDTCQYETLTAIARLKTNFFEMIEAELNDPESSDRMHNFIVQLGPLELAQA